MPISLIVHGGAWDIPDDEVAEHQAGCRAALDAGWRVLEAGGAALDAVEAAVHVLEDAPIFDAGIGSVLNRDGDVELDAAIMDGPTLRSGAVAAVRRVRNPITLARRVLESQVVLLVGQGAERFAQAAGLTLCDPAELIVDRERARWQELLNQQDFRTQDSFGAKSGDKEKESQGDGTSSNLPISLAPGLPLSHPGDTVGCVALDRAGRLAAGTSTGGTANKLPGRVGDSPLIGAGLYADNQTGGCSTTGWGESIMKVLLAKTATDLIGAGRDPMAAARQAIDTLARRVGGLGGCILLDSAGRVGLAFNTPRMAYAYRVEGDQEVVGI
ncbi:MAG TPA: isoaspartyl peptidase/L-asparaginase [Roseiflexaceae bacterium]|nr:isoaspartyl peptidase/L-asparaginase [Roseiflexaceae bacterium]